MFVDFGLAKDRGGNCYLRFELLYLIFIHMFDYCCCAMKMSVETSKHLKDYLAAGFYAFYKAFKYLRSKC